MSRIYTVQTSAVVHHIDLAKIADIRHEPRGNRATVYFSGGGEITVMFPSNAELGQFVNTFHALYRGG